MTVCPAQFDPTSTIERLTDFDLAVLVLILESLQEETNPARRIEILEGVGSAITQARESQHE